MAWREDNRRKPTGTQFLNVAGAVLGHPVSRQWAGTGSADHQLAQKALPLWHRALMHSLGEEMPIYRTHLLGGLGEITEDDVKWATKGS
jgi:hypothetical protein